MSRRRPKAEMQFGSDSFLDVVANIVGILIILIVIAGLRVSQFPVMLHHPHTEQVKPETQQAPPILAVTPPPVEEPPEPVAMELPKPVRPPLPELVDPAELVDLTQQLETEIAAATAEEDEVAEQHRRIAQRQVELVEREKAILAMITLTKDEVEANRKEAEKYQADLELARETLLRLAKQVEEFELKPTNSKTLEHRITPVSRVVNGREKHYRLEQNRIAEVPVDELVNRLKDQIDRRKDWLVKTRQHQGQIGPLRGFTMQYFVRVDSLSGLDEMRVGHGGYRISLSSWEIRPELDMRGETAEVAMRRGSQFYQSLLGSAPDTTLTFWVYSDSFALFQTLQKFAHDHGFSVAGRPLPDGVQISGSPNGSKSASQ